VALAPPTAFEDLGPLIFGDHALNLQEQLVFGGLAHRPVEEDDLNARPLQFVHKQHLIGIFPGEPIRRMHIEALDPAGSDQIAQSLQGWPNEGGPTIAFIDKLVVRRQGQPIGRHPRLEGGELRSDGVGLGLLLGRDPRINGCVHCIHIIYLRAVAWCATEAPDC